MDAITCIETRRTAPLLTGPEPTPAQLETLLRAASRAPDHKLLRPWRFIIVKGEARSRLGEALAAAVLAENPSAPAEVVAKQRGKPTRSPLLLVVVASPAPEGKAPLWEQHASVAAAAQNICLAAHALGLGSAWKSSNLGDAPAVRAVLGTQPHENCFGWIELGQLPADVRLKDRPEVPLERLASWLDGAAVRPYNRETFK